MLVLSRKKREAVVVGNAAGDGRLLTVTVLEIIGGNVKLGFEAGGDIPIHRLEVWERLCASGESGFRPADKAPLRLPAN